MKVFVFAITIAAAVAAQAGMLIPDVNGDGRVNILDLIRIRSALGSDPSKMDATVDVNGDGRIDVRDLILVRNSLGAEGNTDAFARPTETTALDDSDGFSASPLPVSLAADYFPLQVGNYWEYEVRRQGFPVSQYKVEVVGRAYSYHYYTFYWLAMYFPNTPPQKRLVCRTYSNNVLEWPQTARTANVWYKLGAPIGSSWCFSLEGGEPCYSPLSATLESRAEKVDVPAGVFADCIKVAYGHACSDAGLEAEWFAPGAGLVKRVETTFAGPVETVLTKACVDGEIIPGLHLLNGYGVLVKSDAPSYTNNLMPPGVMLPTLHATLAVFNYGQTPVTFNFNTSQRFDFVIRDSAGAEVYRWSDGRAFMEMLGSETLHNDRLVYRVSILLENRLWVGPGLAPLPDGLYTLEAILTSRDRPLSGTTTFRIQSVH